MMSVDYKTRYREFRQELKDLLKYWTKEKQPVAIAMCNDNIAHAIKLQKKQTRERIKLEIGILLDLYDKSEAMTIVNDIMNEVICEEINKA